MESKLLRYQLPHFFQLEEILLNGNCALDASDTGTGKTYVAVALSHSVKKRPFIICPKSVVPNWISVAKYLGVEIFGIANYELIKGGKYFKVDMLKNKSSFNLTKATFPYIKIITHDAKNKTDEIENKINDTEPIVDETNTQNTEDEPDNNSPESIEDVEETLSDDKNLTPKILRKNIKDYVFTPPDDMMVIFDEVHRCKNYKSITSKLLLSIFRSNCKCLLLSATISDKLECFRPFGVVFGFYKDIRHFKPWIKRIEKGREVYYKKKNMTKKQITLDIIHSKLFPKLGSRMKIKDLGSMFPSNQVLSQAYMSSNKEEIQQQYEIIQEAFKELKQKHTRSSGLGKLITARMKVEMFKVPIMMDIINEGIDSGYSVVVFVNYKETMNTLANSLSTECLIHGDQTMVERQNMIDMFQNNVSKIIICIMQAGGVGISLHDIHGGHPRMSVISPTWSGQDMQQALGRIHRAGSKSPAIQRIVFCAETYEDIICELIQTKLTNITAINDGDLLGPKFTNEYYEERECANDESLLNDYLDEKDSIDDIKDNTKDNTKDEINNTNIIMEAPKQKIIKTKKVTPKAITDTKPAGVITKPVVVVANPNAMKNAPKVYVRAVRAKK